MTWPARRFLQLVEDVTGGNVKVQKKDYLDHGDIPVIDQGLSIIAGYTNEVEDAFSGELPVVIFGDHTRIVKYIDFPFVLGADGVKVLTPKKELDAKFLYHYLNYIEIPNHGYSRHYKFLKERTIPHPSITEQRRIVEILDQADHLRKLSAQAKAKTERVLPALFINMFGDPATNTSMWPEQRLSELVEIGTRLVDPTLSEFSDFPHIGGEQIEKNSGRILDYKLVKESDLRSSKFIFSEKHILYSKIRPYLNKVAFPKFKGLCSADIYPLLPKHPAITPWYLVAALRTQAFLSYALTCSDRLRMPKLNKEQLGAFLLSVPDMKTVAVFEDQAELIAKMTLHRAKVNDQTESLFFILLHRAFSGNLTSAWREVHMKELLVEMEQQTKALNDH